MTSTQRKYHKKNVIILINIILIIAIVFSLWKNFYIKRLSFNLEYDKKSSRLLDFVKNYLPQKKDNIISLLFIFNKFPEFKDIKNIQKIYYKHQKNIQIYTFFCKKFTSPFEMTFFHNYLTSYRLESHYNNRIYNTNYFVLLNKNKVMHVQEPVEALDLNFLIEKQLNPERDYESFKTSIKELKSKIIHRLRKGNLVFLDLISNNIEEISDINNITRAYIVIAECSTCELKNIISDLKLRQRFSKSNSIIIFPVYANGTQLINILNKEKVNFPIYHDIQDQLDLFSIITNQKKRMIVIENEELKLY